MDVVMLLMAEHGLNASTFAARVTASTLSDMYAAITSAVGTLKGRLHGGANRRAMEMLLEIGDVDNAEAYIDAALAEGRRIMGFGHRVYRQTADPRSHILKHMLHEFCLETDNLALYDLAVTVAELMDAKKGLYPNVDFYTAPLLYLLDIPLELFTPIFAISRVPGWTAQVMAQYANNRLLRPLAQYVGPENRPYVPIDERI
jgi:citrate synthase